MYELLSMTKAAVHSTLFPKLQSFAYHLHQCCNYLLNIFQLISEGNLGYYNIWSTSISEHKQEMCIKNGIQAKQCCYNLATNYCFPETLNLRLALSLLRVRKRKSLRLKLISKCYRGVKQGLTPEKFFLLKSQGRKQLKKK